MELTYILYIAGVILAIMWAALFIIVMAIIVAVLTRALIAAVKGVSLKEIKKTRARVKLNPHKPTYQDMAVPDFLERAASNDES